MAQRIEQLLERTTAEEEPADEVDQASLEQMEIGIAWTALFDSLINKSRELELDGKGFSMSGVVPIPEDDPDYNDYTMEVIAPQGIDGHTRDLAIVNLYRDDFHVYTWVARTAWSNGRMQVPTIQRFGFEKDERKFTPVQIATYAEGIVTNPETELEDDTTPDYPLFPMPDGFVGEGN